MIAMTTQKCYNKVFYFSSFYMQIEAVYRFV